MNATTENNNTQSSNKLNTTFISESPQVIVNEPTSPFHQTKAFNQFNISGNINLNVSKPFNSNTHYNPQIVDNRLFQTMQNGRITHVTSSYTSNLFYKPNSFLSHSLYLPQIQNQSPRQYENVLSPTFQPSNKLTVAETVKPTVEEVKTKPSKIKSKKENKPKKVTKVISKEIVVSSDNSVTVSLTPPPSPTTKASSITLKPTAITATSKPKPKQKSKSKSKSKKKVSPSSSVTTTPKADDKESRIVYPNLDISSLFNDDDYYDISYLTFSLKDPMDRKYNSLKVLKPNVIPVVDSDELISLKDIQLPSEVIKEIRLPKRKLQLSSVIPISDSDDEDEEKKNKTDNESMNVSKKIKLDENIPAVKIEKEINNNNTENKVVSNNNVDNIQENSREIDNFIERRTETPFYTLYERFLEDCNNGKLMSV